MGITFRQFFPGHGRNILSVPVGIHVFKSLQTLFVRPGIGNTYHDSGNAKLFPVLLCAVFIDVPVIINQHVDPGRYIPIHILSDILHIHEFRVAGDGAHDCQISAGRLAKDGNVVRVIPIFIGVCPQKADRSLTVTDSPGEGFLLGETVIDRRACIAAVTEVPVHELRLSRLGIPVDKAASMNDDEELRSLSRISVRNIQVQILAVRVLRIGNPDVTCASRPVRAVIQFYFRHGQIAPDCARALVPDAQHQHQSRQNYRGCNPHRFSLEHLHQLSLSRYRYQRPAFTPDAPLMSVFIGHPFHVCFSSDARWVSVFNGCRMDI